FVDQQPLAVRADHCEIVAVAIAERMKVKMPARRHRDAARLKRKELAAPDCHPGVVDGIAEHAAGEGDFPFGQPPLPAYRTALAVAQRSSPAARTSAGKLTLSPPTKVRVTSVCPPATKVSATSIAMTCVPPGSNFTVSPAAPRPGALPACRHRSSRGASIRPCPAPKQRGSCGCFRRR